MRKSTRLSMIVATLLVLVTLISGTVSAAPPAPHKPNGQ